MKNAIIVSMVVAILGVIIATLKVSMSPGGFASLTYLGWLRVADYAIWIAIMLILFGIYQKR